jgi:hypothetical protein
MTSHTATSLFRAEFRFFPESWFLDDESTNRRRGLKLWKVGKSDIGIFLHHVAFKTVYLVVEGPLWKSTEDDFFLPCLDRPLNLPSKGPTSTDSLRMPLLRHSRIASTTFDCSPWNPRLYPRNISLPLPLPLHPHFTSLFGDLSSPFYIVRNFPCQTLKISKVSLVVMGS